MIRRLLLVIAVLALTASSANAYTATKKGLTKRLMAVMTQALNNICSCETERCLMKHFAEMLEPRLAVAGRKYYLNATKISDDLREWKASPDAATWDGYAFELFIKKENPKFMRNWSARFERCAKVISG